MKSGKRELIEIVILIIITLLLFGALFLSVSTKKEKDNDVKEPPQEEETLKPENNQNEDELTSEKEEDNQNKDEKPQTQSENNKTNSNVSENSSPSTKPQKDEIVSENDNETSKSNDDNNDNDKKTEESVISYLENKSLSLDKMKSEDNKDFRTKAKEIFTETVDFLFYGSTIKGYTFNELTTSAKLKILSIACKIDYKIDSYFPNYKESIKEGYSNLKGKAALMYLDTTAKLCESVGESACDEARSNFKDMKESFGFTWDIIKTAASSSYKSLKTVLNEWYQSIK